MSLHQVRVVREISGWTADCSVTLVTGAGGAIGSAIAARLAASGSAVILVDRDGEAAEKAALANRNPCLVIEADLGWAGSAAAIMDIVASRVGRLDNLVNNAGLNIPQTIRTVSAGDWDEVMAVNLRAPMLLAQKAIPFWEAQGGGSIVNIGSRVWVSGSIPAYTASKAGIVGLTRSLAVELGRFNVRANAVAPSYLDTPFTRQNRSAEVIAKMQKSVRSITPLPRIGTAADIANAVAFLVSDQASFITGEVLHVCGGAQLAAQSYSFHETQS